jgi:hypothetical protein
VRLNVSTRGKRVFITELNLRRLHYSTQQLGAGKRVRKHLEVAGSVKRVV